MNYIVYHGIDHDGQASAYIAKTYYEDVLGQPVTLLPADYGSEPNLKQELAKPWDDSNIIVLDFCFEDESVMTWIKENFPNAIWIDHHISAIKRYGNLDFKGIRDTQFSACELSWRFFFKNIPCPAVITYLGMFDTWRYGNNLSVLYFEYYAQSLNLSPDSKHLWRELLSWSVDEINSNSFRVGESISNRLKKVWKEELESTAFEATINGYKCICLNTQSRGSMVFDSKLSQYDFALSFKNVRNKFWKFSVYTTNPNLDASVFAKTIANGGGHKGAAGFQLKIEPQDSIKADADNVLNSLFLNQNL